MLLTTAKNFTAAAPKSSLPDARANLLLAALPDEGYQCLLPSLEFVNLSLGEILYDSGDEMPYLYFPVTSIVSLLYTMESGSTAEMGMVGRCGVVGISVFLGGMTTPNQAVVQIAGGALRIKAKIIQDEFARAGALQRILLCYTQSLLTQISQVSVCNRLHTFEQRLCRWLLFSHDCVMKDEIVLTQEIISHLLGVRREGVTVVAGRLQEAGLISYVRGHIHILDRQGLEKNTCECYEVVKDESERLLAL
ncbi:MAG: Crp/Fnr family transcriptional regulator [Acidobacteriota bacterium]|nr:Crp/Fnr family transcriptional regulator [Acidobacteriota bacterium]